jgi:hypothetical protein
MTTNTIAIPNFAEPKFYGVASKPDVVILEIHLANGEAVPFCITPDALKEFAIACYAQATIQLGEIEPDDELSPAPFHMN